MLLLFVALFAGCSGAICVGMVASPVTTYSYDAASNLSGYTYQNSVQTTNTFDPLNRLMNPL